MATPRSSLSRNVTPVPSSSKPDSEDDAVDHGDSLGSANNGTMMPSHDPPPRRRRRRQNKTADRAAGGLRFLTVDHPEKFRDPTNLRANRQHVMQDYLVKREQNNPLGAESSTLETSRPLRRHRAANPSASSHQFHTQTWQSVVPSEPSRSSDQSPTTYASPMEDEATINLIQDVLLPPDVPISPVTQAAHEDQQLIVGSAGQHKDRCYHETQIHALQFLYTRLGSALKPFDIWPGFEDKTLDIVQLKLRCNLVMGSTGLGQHWVPLLVKDRHSFVSTCAISAAHDDIMIRAVRTPYVRLSKEWYARMRIHHEVTCMVQEALADPVQATSDATIIAVIHLLMTDAMGCDDRIMNMHHKGLQQMVSSRGGLAAFNGNHAMCQALSTTLYTIAILRERMPPLEYMQWTEKQPSAPPADERLLPESPLYFRQSGFYTLPQALSDGLETLQLLEDLRELTATFLGLSKPTGCSPTGALLPLGEQHASMERLSDKILSYGHHKLYNFSRSIDRYRYEAIRLTGQIYAYALSNRIPFSRAAQHMPRTIALAPGESERLPLPIPTQIKYALLRSNLSETWGHLAGVLFWVVCVAGAAANPHRLEFYFDRRETSDEETRKFLCAIAMRLVCLLTWNHSMPFVETLKRMISIQQTLEPGEDELDITQAPVLEAVSSVDTEHSVMETD